MGRRVVVTGLGLAVGTGVGVAALAAASSGGQSALRPLEGRLQALAPGAGSRLDLPGKELGRYFDTRLLRTATMTRQTTLGCVAAGDALRQAGIFPDGSKHTDRGAYLGSYIVPPDFTKQARAARILSHRPSGEGTGWVLDDERLAEAMKMASAFDFLRALPNMPSSHLSIQCGYQGPACTYLGSDASGLQAVGLAARAVEDGLAEVMVAGGAFCPFQEVHLLWQGTRGLWAGAGEDSGRRVRPYGAGRSGTLPGEGGAMLVLEEESHARRRNAPILAEFLGFGQRVALCGARDEAQIAAECLLAALPSGRPQHGGPMALGHGHQDALESEAWTRAWGGLPELSAVALPPLLGFMGPASGPAQLVAALLAARGDLCCSPLSDVAADCSTLGTAVGRRAGAGAGATIVASTFSFDGVHAAVALRAC